MAGDCPPMFKIFSRLDGGNPLDLSFLPYSYPKERAVFWTNSGPIQAASSAAIPLIESVSEILLPSQPTRSCSTHQ